MKTSPFAGLSFAAFLMCILASTAATVTDTLHVQLSVAETAGMDRPLGHVTSGVPFPPGAVASNAVLRLLDDQQRKLPLQSQVTATWRDGSLKWALLDFQVPLKAGEVRELMLESGGEPQTQPSAAPLGSEIGNRQIAINTGPLRAVFAPGAPGFLRSVAWSNRTEPPFLHDALAPDLQLAPDHVPAPVTALAPEQLVLEENGPLRAVVRAEGWIVSGGTNRLVKYVTRVTAFAGSAQLQVRHTITQLSDRKMLLVREHSLALPFSAPATALTFGGNRGPHAVQLSNANIASRITQLAENRYEVQAGTGPASTGLKAGGWIAVRGTNGTLLVGIKHFWQQFPKTIEASPAGLRLGLYAGVGEAGKPFDMDQGLAKTHEILLSFGDPETDADPNRVPDANASARQLAAFEKPLFAIAPTSWYCDSKVFGDLLPFDFDRFPDYETLTEASADQFIKRMATGTRHWGDVYYGGEYKGTNSYTNLEYDMHHNFFVQFARTGLRKYLDTGFTMAAHQADIDTNHKTGWQWKHSPRHTEIQAEFGHTFTRGLLEAYFLSGNRTCLEAATQLGDFFAKDILNPRALGNERQIGWALISLLPVYESTWERKYFVAASNTVERLLAGLDANGKFTIRWDNRIAFFNGIAATGFIYYYRATGDERVADAAYRVIRRAQGFYPEYAGRTLEAIAWACDRTRLSSSTGKPGAALLPDEHAHWMDFLARTWETTMARQINWNVMELGAPTIFSVHALPYMARTGLLPEPDAPLRLNLTPAQFNTAHSLHAHHLPSGDADLYLRPPADRPMELVLVRKGVWKSAGTASVYDQAGALVQQLEFPRQNAIWQRQSLSLPAVQESAEKGRAWFRLALRSPTVSNVRGGSYVTWDAVTAQPCAAVFSIPEHRSLEFVTPALYSLPAGNATAIELEVVAEGEGFKRAMICDPDGNVAGSVDGFIDLGDKGRYHYKVRAEIPPGQINRTWSIVLQDVTLEKMSGLVPYFSTSRESFFAPGRWPSSFTR